MNKKDLVKQSYLFTRVKVLYTSFPELLNRNNFSQIRLHNSLIKHTGAGFGSGRGSKVKNVQARWIAGFVKKTQKANRENDENWLCSLSLLPSRVYQGTWPRYTRSHIYVHINTHTCVKNAHMYPSTKQGFKFQCTLQMYTHPQRITQIQTDTSNRLCIFSNSCGKCVSFMQ